VFLSGQPVPGRSLGLSLAEPDRGVLRELTSFELVAGDEDVGADGQLDRVATEVDDAGEAFAAREREDRVA
jgi:hypothetical protein